MKRLTILVGMVLVAALLFGCTMDDVSKILKEVQDVIEDSNGDTEDKDFEGLESDEFMDGEGSDGDEIDGENSEDEETPEGLGNSAEEESDTGQLNIKDYFPMKGNIRYIYDGEGNEYAPFESYVDYVEGNKMQQRIENGGAIVARIIELKDGKVTRLSTIPNASHRENFLDTEDTEKDVLLMEPLAVGTSWTLEDGSGSVREIIGIDVDVETPAGDFKAIEVLTEGEGNKIYDYYAKDIGLIKTVFIVDDYEVMSILREIQEDTPLIQEVKFYYPDVDNNTIAFESKELKFRTNDDINDAFEEAYKDLPNQGLPVVFTENTKINSLKVDEDGIVHLDLNASFADEVEGGARYEGMLLESIAKTFGHYCDAQRIALTIDGGIYETGSILLEEGDYIEISN
ncbi:MAG TPA: GerMN domain-containing protein [Clostridia bacterium]|nr:GerMN domain-containing protein [Clostridia bacterium]